MTLPNVFTIHKQLAELLTRGELEQAFDLTSRYMEPLDDGFLRFNYLWLATRLGKPELALDWLENSLHTDHWLSARFLRRSPNLEPLFHLPRFLKCLELLDEQEQRYWKDERMKPLTSVPPGRNPPYSLLVGLHGNGFNTLDAAQQWACAPQQGWLATFPLAPHLVYCGKHWWDHHEENEPLVLSHVHSILRQFPVAEDKLVWSGFSKGGELAMYLALRGALGHKVFLTVGAGGYLHGEPERWQPIIEAASPEARGVMMYSRYDLERGGNGHHVILSMLENRGIAHQFVEYEADGHLFPADFNRRFREAITFLFEE